MEYSRNGETSYLLDGVITKESILKRRESLLKELKLNPQTNKYDYDGELKSSDLKFFVSDNYDGFIINFGKVTGDFNCSYNNLTSLKGSPQEVGGGFACFNNQLTSLKGAPQKVGGNFECQYNQLTSLEGAPQTVDGGFACFNNQLTSLRGAPQKVGGDFYCYNNPNLHSLDGMGQITGKIYKDF